MSSSVFNVLDEDNVAGTSTSSPIENPSENNDAGTTSNATAEAGMSSDDAGWQVSGSTKRRLAPSHQLSHKDLGADSPRSKATSQELAASKKKGRGGSQITGNVGFGPLYIWNVIIFCDNLLLPSCVSPLCTAVVRFTREEIMCRRKPSKVLSTMMELHDILSIPPLDPVSFVALDHDEVYRLWHADKGNKDKEARGRGKGRGRGTPARTMQ